MRNLLIVHVSLRSDVTPSSKGCDMIVTCCARNELDREARQSPVASRSQSVWSSSPREPA